MSVAIGSRSPTAWGGPRLVDGLLVLVVGALSLLSAGVWLRTGIEASPPYEHTAAVVLLAGAAALAWRRRVPLVVLGATAAAFVGYELVDGESAPLPLAVLVALYSVAAAFPTVVSGGLALGLGAFVVGDAVLGEEPLTGEVVDLVLLGVVAWTLGHGVRVSRARTRALERQAALRVSEADAVTRLAVQSERALIARELHDVVAHHVSVVVAQAAAANRVFEAHPAQARTALQAIEGVGREALVEMRRLLHVLGPDGSEPGTAPQPGLGQLSALVDTVRAAGLPVDLQVRGTVRPLPASLELHAYRIVQEALTNTLKHAGPARAQVLLVYGPDQLEVQVCDDGAGGARRTAAGRGLAGMRERASLLGGRVSAGPGDRAGFAVSAALPTGTRT